MLNCLPDDILSLIMEQACFKPSEYLILMNINKRIYRIIDT